jgi:cbb3-type cytochrome oxidase subunit 3
MKLLVTFFDWIFSYILVLLGLLFLGWIFFILIENKSKTNDYNLSVNLSSHLPSTYSAYTQ